MPKTQTSLLSFFKRNNTETSFVGDNENTTALLPLSSSSQDSSNKKFSNSFGKPFLPYNKQQHYKDSRRFLENQKHTDFKTVWKGFAFVATNNFSEWTVKTSYLRNDYRAEKLYEGGHTVGTATLDENSALVHIQIDSPFRRMGLATKLISFINKTCPQFHVYAGVQNNSRYRLTEEGAKLINACQRKNILDDEKVILNTVPPSPHMASPR